MQHTAYCLTCYCSRDTEKCPGCGTSSKPPVAEKEPHWRVDPTWMVKETYFQVTRMKGYQEGFVEALFDRLTAIETTLEIILQNTRKR